MSEFKEKIKVIIDRFTMFSGFYDDYKQYKKWNYNNPSLHTRSAQEAKILRQTHIIEKGMSLSSPRKGFGQEKITGLLRMLDEYLHQGFPTDDIVFQNAICVLAEYIQLQKELNYENPDLSKKVEALKVYVKGSFQAGIVHTNLEKLNADKDGVFPTFFESRHSIRQFSNEPVDIRKIEAAVELAQKAPSACNRQACKVYCYKSSEINKKLGELILGNNGFDAEVQNYLVITADISAFHDSFERNQLYIEAGIFLMSLIQALHYYGIASCALQNGEFIKKNKEFKKVCGNIPENEKITIFIAIGNYKKEFSYAVSRRKKLESVLIVS